MFKLIANIFGYVVNFIYGFIGNYGISIIIFTVILRLILLPMSIKQQKTTKKSAKLQGELNELQEKYANDQVKLSQEMQDLYKRENMSPFSGCLSSIVQLIIIISMFYLVANPLTYMLHLPEETITSYKEEIAEVDGAERYAEIAIIKNLSDKYEEVDINMNFLGLNLSDVPTIDYEDVRVFIIPILYVITSILSMRLTTMMTGEKKDKKDKKNNKDLESAKKEDEKLVKKDEQDSQAEMMNSMNRSMRYITPFMAVMVALIAPLGLALYWLVSNLLMIIERLIINRVVKDEEEE